MSLEVLANRVRPEVSECPDPVIDAKIIEAGRIFCQRSHAWTERLDEGMISRHAMDDMGRHSMTLTHPSGREIIQPAAMLLQDGALEPYRYDAWEQKAWFKTPSSQIVEVWCVFQPAAGVDPPDQLTKRWSDALFHGALAQLRMMPGFAWSQPAMVDYHNRMFEDFITEAKGRSAKMFASGGMRLRVKAAH